MGPKSNWNPIFEKRASSQLGWFQPHLRSSLQRIAPVALSRTSPTIDIGGGDSTLIDDPTAQGNENISRFLTSRPEPSAERERASALRRTVSMGSSSTCFKHHFLPATTTSGTTGLCSTSSFRKRMAQHTYRNSPPLLLLKVGHSGSYCTI